VRILVAEDEPVSRLMLARLLQSLDHEVLTADDGMSAWTLMQSAQPQLAIVDWLMPGLDGPELCRRVRAHPPSSRMYLILLTSRGEQADVVTGLGAGADDYLVKPFDREELGARIRAAERVITLQELLASRVTELETALADVRLLAGLVPICAYCKSVRSDQDYWQQIDSYLAERTAVEFTHGVCPTCMAKVIGES
jgi:sigma-B regulation protein RsbU (phosphoserine phosphatase)